MKCVYLINLLLTMMISRSIGRPHHCNHDIEWSGLPNYDVDADRVYYIGCVEREWDYCPTGKNVVTGEPFSEGSAGSTWCLGNGEDRIGSTYLKGLYREFDDKCFKEEKERIWRDEHLGSLGPIIRALTGETIKVFYKNMCSFPNSMHAHGFAYDKLSEGALYHDGSIDGDLVEAGDGWVYIWKARDSMVDKGISSQMWLYHSHVNEPIDAMTGLIGGIIVTKNGQERDRESDLKPKDVNREYVTFFILYDENESHLAEDNVRKYLGVSASTDGDEDDEFVESNLMHSINGYLFGNLQTLWCSEGETVRWHTASFGNEMDGPHSPHWHGNIASTAQGHNTDTLVLIGGTTESVTMTVDAPGQWLYHCHVHDHIDAGMMTTYFVEEGSFVFSP
eukprot:127084_1